MFDGDVDGMSVVCGDAVWPRVFCNNAYSLVPGPSADLLLGELMDLMEN